MLGVITESGPSYIPKSMGDWWSELSEEEKTNLTSQMTGSISIPEMPPEIPPEISSAVPPEISPIVPPEIAPQTLIAKPIPKMWVYYGIGIMLFLLLRK